MNTLTLFLLILRAALLSTGGFGNAPALHADLVRTRGWATDEQFGAAFAVGQVSPGPNGLWVISLGYLVNGWPGALAALAAITLPPLLVVWVERAYQRVQSHPATEGFVRGLGLSVTGAFLIVLGRLLVGEAGTVAADQILIAFAALLLGLSGRVPTIVILLLAALAGIVRGG